jgi:predicted RNase H-like HicB family nuclease
MNSGVERYRVYVEPLAERLGGGFVAYAPQLKGCVSDGATPAEALNSIYDAISCWIEGAIENGQPVPEPDQIPMYA